jgi:transcriptional regulator with XRE-family HTH domain
VTEPTAEDRAVGAAVRRCRRLRGLDQRTVAGLVGRDQSWLSRIESGRSSLSRATDIEALAGVLAVHPADLLGHSYAGHGSRTAEVDALIPAIRVALVDEVPDVRPLPVAELARRVVRVSRVMWRDGDLTSLAAALPGLLGAVRAAAGNGGGEEDRRRAAELLSVLCSVAFPMLKNLGYTDLALVAANRCTAAAEELGDPLWRAYAGFRRSHALMPAGSPDRAVDVARGAVDGLEPHVRGDDPAALRMLGMAHLTVALWAGRAGRTATAVEHIDAATQVAARVDDGEWFDITFGPAQVAIHRVGIAATLGDGDRTPVLAALVDPAAVPSSVHRAFLAANVGHGLGQDRRHGDEAVRALRRAEDLAPQRMRTSRHFRDLVAGVLGQPMRPASLRELRGLAYRVGLDAA